MHGSHLSLLAATSALLASAPLPTFYFVCRNVSDAPRGSRHRCWCGNGLQAAAVQQPAGHGHRVHRSCVKSARPPSCATGSLQPIISNERLPWSPPRTGRPLVRGRMAEAADRSQCCRALIYLFFSGSCAVSPALRSFRLHPVDGPLYQLLPVQVCVRSKLASTRDRSFIGKGISSCGVVKMEL